MTSAVTLLTAPIKIPLRFSPSRHRVQVIGRRAIVTQLTPTTSLLRSEKRADNEVYLLGTAHVSAASSAEVADLIRLVNPETVFVELDSGRAAELRRSGSSQTFDLSTNPMFSGGGLPGPFASLANMPQMKPVFDFMKSVPSLLKRTGVFSPMGSDMKTALYEADRIGARCVYGDIEFDQTIRDLKGSINATLSDPSLLTNLRQPESELLSIFQDILTGRRNPSDVIEEVKTRKHAIQMSSYLKQSFPPIHHIMVGKRDEHMAKVLHRDCSSGKVVAVVGLAHIDGIEREWAKLDASK